MTKHVKKIPVILQMEALECGAASLAMILAYYKKYIPLERLRIDCNVSRDGSNAKYILMAARHHGLKAKGYRYDINTLKNKIKFPAIIHWNFKHFVVLNGFKKDMAAINDPACGYTEVDMETFNKAYTGIVLEFEPEEGFMPEGKPKSVGSFLAKRLSGSVLPLIFILILGFVLSFLELIKPVFYKIFVDKILIGNAPDWINPMLLSMTAVMLAAFMLEAVRNVYLYKIKAKMSVTTGAMFIWHVLRLPVEFFAQRMAGDISSRLKSNDTIVQNLCEKLAPVVLNAVMIGIYFILMFYYDPGMALIGMSMVIGNLIFMRYISQKNINSNRNLKRDYGKLSGIMISGISMIETVKAAGAEFGYLEKLTGYQAKYNNSYLDSQKKVVSIQIVPMLLGGLCNSAILLLGVAHILSGRFTIGSLMAFQGYMSLFLTPVGELVSSVSIIQDVSANMERVEDVMNYTPDVRIELNAPTPLQEYHKLSGRIDLINISFGYSSLAEPLISDFSLTVEKGSMIAFVGGSGSGKSTMAKIIAGLYQVRSGAILYDGRTKEEVDRYSFTNSVAVVDQTIQLFCDTIRNNITLWDTTVEEEIIISACKDACIHEDIMAYKEGYDTLVDEGGKNFSGGQRQRIEIARALAVNPSVLILDEATSALDPVIEKSIMDSIKKRGITCFIIAHRLSTIRDADQIIMFEYGREVERGTHEELMDRNGRYASLVRSD